MVGSHQQDGHRPGGDGKMTWSPSLSGGVLCSICLESVLDNVGRSRAKLQCGHEFHLDCIGSAFNIKGSMQCPNCRKVEKGQWLYANGSARSVRELSMDDYMPDEGYYYFGYPETHYRFHWCPFGEITQLGSSFEEVESPSPTHHESARFHTAYAQSTAPSSIGPLTTHPGSMPPTSVETSETTEDHNNWNAPAGHNNFFGHVRVSPMNIQYFNVGRHASPFSLVIGNVNVAEPVGVPHMPVRPSIAEHDARMRPPAFADPFPFGYRSVPAVSGSHVSSSVPRQPGRVSHGNGYPHRLQSSGVYGVPASPVMVPQHEHGGGGGFFVVPNTIGLSRQEAESSLPSHFHAW